MPSARHSWPPHEYARGEVVRAGRDFHSSTRFFHWLVTRNGKASSDPLRLHGRPLVGSNAEYSAK
jgi:hypothetical protein